MKDAFSILDEQLLHIMNQSIISGIFPEAWKLATVIPLPTVNNPSGVSDYTDYAGPEIPINSRIASPFSQQIAIGNAGPSSALEPMGAKRSFRCHLLNIAPIYKQ